MSAPLRTHGLSSARPHCVCVQVQNYGYDQAAAKLGCKRRFLEDRISELPHQKIGEAAVFCDCDLRVIQAMCTQIPDQVRKELGGHVAPPEAEPVTAPTGRRSLREVRPATSRRRPADTAVP